MNEIIVNALKSLNIPVAFMKYLGTAPAYIVFQEYNHRNSKFSDNNADAEAHYIQLNFWYTDPADYAKIAIIQSLMEQAGFYLDYDKDFPNDNKDNYYGRVMDFIYENLK